MTRPFMTKKITVEELTNIELKNEALRHKGNPTLEIYRMDVDRDLQHKSKCEEVLYVGDQRMAAVAWEETVQLREDVDSAEKAFDQVLREMEG